MLLEQLKEELEVAGIKTEIIQKSPFLRQIVLPKGDVVEGMTIRKLEAYGFGHGVIDNIEADEAFRLITGEKNPEAMDDDFSFNMPAGTLVTEDFVDSKTNELPPVTFEPGYVQLGEAHSHINERATYATFVKKAFDTWQWMGYCFKDCTQAA